MIRVLVVDDAAAVRHLLRVRLAMDREIEVVGTARNGAEALEQIETLRPDVVILDLEMPVLDGRGVLQRLKGRRPRPQVLVFSTYAREGARAAVEALQLGAADFVRKPSGGHEAVQAVVRDELIPRIKLLGGRGRARVTTPQARAAPSPGAGAVRAVVIAASTGGPQAVREVVGALPAGLPVPVLVVQHMPALFVEQFVRSLDAACAFAVRAGEDGARVRPGEAWVAPGDRHMEVRQEGGRVVLHLHQGPPENGVRPAADPLLRSAAAVWGGGVLAVILTGMGQDGLAGCRAVREAGGRVIAQDEATSVVWGMPGAVAQAGLADAVLPLARIGPAVKAAVAAAVAPGGAREAHGGADL
ncbi:protein-glutamate methylesterase/protein-glutamine glutaminase [Inmirania thermothiophila]|uniref:Protein-glutamate methylesterase/protein-glutamine glutaminase n=1 Tax=Inmirania thermothiophila TaxID=1750597 RepID=A0A3N1Y1X8_9GAMM|nr:chemotaxis response regulator protein-glutamate methylesterase [Inmirania thermothiophila]ROR32518.1 two-component system chemotaxis response regulator CheB [Inmirania thermothiophila]